MARIKRNVGINTRNKRLALSARREPYWAVIAEGRALGYRKGSNGGSWIARFRGKDGKQAYQALGPADDLEDDTGGAILSYTRAAVAARAYFERAENLERGGESPRRSVLTVADAIDDYFTHRAAETAKPKALLQDRKQADAHIIPRLGSFAVDQLTRGQLDRWKQDVATAPRRVRTAKGALQAVRDVDLSDGDTLRARRATANRVLTILKAALNHAFENGRVGNDAAWRAVKPFAKVDAAVIHFLSEDEARRLINASSLPFRDLLQAALLTGARYGELTRMAARDFVASSGVVNIRESKSGNPRAVALSDEGIKFFQAATAGKAGGDLVFERAPGVAWAASDQARPMAAAAAAAKINPRPTFHILRHTYASWLAMRGVPLTVIAAQLGHADTRITAKHYAHLAPSYVADTFRANFPVIGVEQPDAVVPITAARRA